MKSDLNLLIAISTFMLSTSITSHASTLISVNAGDNGYTGWTESLTSANGSENGTFLGSTGSDINTTGVNGTVSWTLYANNGQTSARTFSLGGGALAEGQTLSIKMDNGSIDTGGTVGFSLQTAGGTNRFEFYYIGNDLVNSYKINDAGGQENVSPNVGFTTSGLTLAFTQLASGNYSFSINGTAISNSGLTISASDIEKVRIFNFNAGAGNDQHFNTLSVVPEPSTIGLLGLASIGTLGIFRRRH